MLSIVPNWIVHISTVLSVQYAHIEWWARCRELRDLMNGHASTFDVTYFKTYCLHSDCVYL